MKFLKTLFKRNAVAPASGIDAAVKSAVDAALAEREAWLRDLLGREVDRVDAEGRPILTPLAIRLRDIDILALNIKYFGYELAKRLAADLPPRSDVSFRPIGLTCKPATQADLESDWCAYWASELKVPVIFHRKLWELCFLLQVLAERGCMVAGTRGIGFGCGEEPIASYLASRGVECLVTDLAAESAGTAGWRDTNQHLGSRDVAFKADLVSQATFETHVRHANVDMNAIPADLTGFDFCWSICALEHLGSIDNAMDFIVNALDTLRPGGLAVHTTEFNFLDTGKTLDNWPTVLPQRRHFEALAERLKRDGHDVAPRDFDVGARPLDRFIDVAPYPGDPGRTLETMGAAAESHHLKISVDGFATTCFGLIIRKADA